MRTLGILGGVGPETTSNFYLYIISQCQKFGGLSRPNILIQNLPIPYKTEEQLLLHGKDINDYLKYLIQYSKLLESAGADFIVMPCNTLHFFEPEIKDSVKIPFISIVDVTTAFLQRSKPRKVGIIGTKVTLESKFYQNRFEEVGIDCHIPNEFQQVKIAKMIYGLVNNQYANSQRQILVEIIEDFANADVSLVLLACTDLQALIPQHPRTQVIDTMNLLADEAIRQIHATA